MEDRIRQIIAQAINAPSGDNMQPWLFKISKNELQVFNNTESDESMYNFLQRGSYLAIGAMLENIFLLSPNYDLEAKIEYSFDGNQKDQIAKVWFYENNVNKKNDLANYIYKRCTNRKPYRREKLKNEDIQLLRDIVSNSNTKLKLLIEKEQIDKLAKVLPLNERLLLQNMYIHKYLFSYIRWSLAEEEMTRDGLYIGTFELPPPQKNAFKIFRNWPIIKMLGTIRVPSLVAKANTQLYQAAGAYGLILIPNLEINSFLDCGRIMQKVWLLATKIGISFQPTTALLYLQQRIEAGEIGEFTQDEIKLINSANHNIKDVFGVVQGIPAMIFRLGYSEPPSAKSLKRPPIYIQ